MTTLGVSPYDGLEPAMWRYLLARAAVFRAVRGQLTRLSDAAERIEVVNLLLLTIYAAARKASREECDDDAAVRRVVRRSQKAVTKRLGDAVDDADARDLLNEFGRLVAEATPEDPFGPLFDGIARQARELYGSSWRTTRLEVAHLGSNPWPDGAAQHRYPLKASTKVTAEPDGALVELQIHGDGFGPAVYASVPTFLLHELVCHAPARQDRVKNDSEFAEGFMDWAAYRFLDKWAGRIDPDLAPAARSQAEQVKEALVQRYGGEAGVARRLGHAAADNLRSWFERECRLDPDESTTKVALLAVQLNQVPRPLAAKDLFVTLLGWGKPPPDLESALRDWSTGDLSAEALLDRVQP